MEEGQPPFVAVFVIIRKNTFKVT